VTQVIEKLQALAARARAVAARHRADGEDELAREAEACAAAYERAVAAAEAGRERFVGYMQKRVEQQRRTRVRRAA
jgi:hypothetical protein